ncbi:Pyrroline-5-carboxylate reductase 2 [Blattella germanica]|nr:Pyrroline-5-carboxylate reductase 2 [Blattella germanica]
MIKIGFVGAGNIAQALAKGFIAAGLTKAEKIIASDPFPASLKKFEAFGAQTTRSNEDIVKEADVVFLAVKPTVLQGVLSTIKSHVSTRHLILSTAMGISIRNIEQALPAASKVIRVMPNTPVFVRNGACVYVCGSAVEKEDEAIVRKLLDAVGTCDRIPESMIDAVTALSGSGPAYVYVMIEALADGAVRMGLPRDLAYRLTAQTVLGAAHMVQNTNLHPGQLKDNVTSPAGTTAEGLHYLEKNGIRSALIGAIEAATLKSQQLNKEDR